jgi:hypothetical protein
MRAWLAFVALVIGCDTRAGASDPQAGARAEQKGREYETCGASLHCQDNLRCVDHMCQRTARSTVGDYHAAAGAAAMARGDFDAAIAAYSTAVAQYDAEKLGPAPPDIDCAYGAALASARAKKEHAELGARVLHRCVIGAPPGGAMRDQALAHLATLAEVGLDPLLLGASKTADAYLTKSPQRPSSDKLGVTVTASPTPAAKSFALVSGKLTEAGVKPDLVACWDAYSTAAKKDAMTVTVPMKSVFVPGEYEDDPATYAFRLEAAPAGLAGPDAAADACVRRVVEGAVKGTKMVDSFNARVAITIK